MKKSREPKKLCSVCSIDNGKECTYTGNLHCDFKEKIKHKQIYLN